MSYKPTACPFCLLFKASASAIFASAAGVNVFSLPCVTAKCVPCISAQFTDLDSSSLLIIDWYRAYSSAFKSNFEIVSFNLGRTLSISASILSLYCDGVNFFAIPEVASAKNLFAPPLTPSRFILACSPIDGIESE